MRYIPVLLLLIALPLWAATVWKWRDADGVVHYSDQPVPGAEQIGVQTLSTFSSVPVGSGSSNSAAAKPQASSVTYTNVEIWKPSAEMTITAGTGGQVSVGARVEPALAKDHRLALYMDGRLVPGFPQQGMEYDMAEVDRGAHTLVLAVVDAQGKQVTTSAPVQFYVQRPSLLNSLPRPQPH